MKSGTAGFFLAMGMFFFIPSAVSAPLVIWESPDPLRLRIERMSKARMVTDRNGVMTVALTGTPASMHAIVRGWQFSGGARYSPRVVIQGVDPATGQIRSTVANLGKPAPSGKSIVFNHGLQGVPDEWESSFEGMGLTTPTQSLLDVVVVFEHNKIVVPKVSAAVTKLEARAAGSSAYLNLPGKDPDPSIPWSVYDVDAALTVGYTTTVTNSSGVATSTPEAFIQVPAYGGASPGLLPAVVSSQGTVVVNMTTPVSGRLYFSAYNGATTKAACATGGVCSIGDTGPGGGIVFYDAGTQNSWGRYIEVAPAGWNGYVIDPQVSWCDKGLGQALNTSTSIGAGAVNTGLLNGACSSSASSVISGFQPTPTTGTIWSLPSRDDLAKLYQQSSIVVKAGLMSGNYWSSSQTNPGSTDIQQAVSVFAQQFNDDGSSVSGGGSNGNWTLFDKFFIRPVHYF